MEWHVLCIYIGVINRATFTGLPKPRNAAPAVAQQLTPSRGGTSADRDADETRNVSKDIVARLTIYIRVNNYATSADPRSSARARIKQRKEENGHHYAARTCASFLFFVFSWWQNSVFTAFMWVKARKPRILPSFYIVFRRWVEAGWRVKGEKEG